MELEAGVGDILEDVGYLGLGSRLKRLAERLLNDAALIHAESGETIQPGQFPLIAALDRYGPLTVNQAVDALGVSQPAVTRAASELVKAGLAASTPSEVDKRQKTIALSPAGRDAVDRMKRSMWPRVEAAARAICATVDGDFLQNVAAVERGIAERPLADRVLNRDLEIVPFRDSLAQTFYDINAEWIADMFVLEPHDEHVLQHPRETILDLGGEILFVRAAGLGIVGTCALQPSEGGFTELTKMGVRASARGRKAGEFLLQAALEKAKERGFDDQLFLLTNTKCASAIHLYEKHGFVHDAEIKAMFGGRYGRCDVAMRYRGDDARA